MPFDLYIDDRKVACTHCGLTKWGYVGEDLWKMIEEADEDMIEIFRCDHCDNEIIISDSANAGQIIPQPAQDSMLH